MPKNPAPSIDPATVEQILHQRGFKHLRARKHGAAVIVESGPEADALKHLRLRRETPLAWSVDIADHRGRWEPTPFSGTLPAILRMVADDFPWVLKPIDEYPERLSDPDD